MRRYRERATRVTQKTRGVNVVALAAWSKWGRQNGANLKVYSAIDFGQKAWMEKKDDSERLQKEWQFSSEVTQADLFGELYRVWILSRRDSIEM